MLTQRRVLSFLAAGLLATALPAQFTYLQAALDGAQEVPPNPSTARGFGMIALDFPTSTVRIMAYGSGFAGTPTAAHMHQAAAGVNGGVVIGLSGGPNLWTGTGTLTSAQVSALFSSGMYLNIHTTTSPGGEIRGQLVGAQSTRLTCQLSGANEVPPNASTATGSCTAFLHEPDNRLLYMVDSQGLSNVTAAHVHQAAVGVNGGVVFPLNGGNGTYCGVSDRLTPAQVSALQGGGMYVNVHTSAFPGGEIRGQLMPTDDDFMTSLDGGQEVPPNSSAGFGEASLHVRADGNALLFLSYAGLSGPATAAHIHTAGFGQNGPVTVPLASSGPNSYIGAFAMTPTFFNDVRAGNWYVNVHTAAFPGGEIRGQLGGTKIPRPYGGGCAGSNGIPAIGAEGAPAVAGTFDVNLYGAANSSLCALALGFDRDRLAGVVDLPLELTAMGVNAPGCFVLLDPLGSLVQFTNVMGCATQTVPLPFAPSMHGLLFYGQWLVFDAAANPAGVVTSNGLTMILP